MSQHLESLTLYRGWPDQGKHVWSPFVVKLEARLRFAGVSYVTAAGSPKTAPKGKIPYVEYQMKQQSSAGATNPPVVKMGDSGLITKHFVEEGVLPDLNGGLSPEDMARDLATRALLENKLYFYHTRERWLDHYYAMRDHALSAIPWPIRVVVGLLVYRSHKATLYGQGTLRLSDEEIRASKREIWDRINSVLTSVRSKRSSPHGETTETSKTTPFWFLGGDAPTEVDAVIFGFIVSVLICTAGPESKDIVAGYPVLLDYAGRIHDVYFPDYEKWP
ncbi:hypothetical protein VP1G_07028 [Cytospora mali]|uniref:Thioredoxin-like fold domain-containing protein n=1 Tax=Cytospora mali TaxID=578113 RepID=A0A194V762_CYTMA|nr:hypothetical protein VP1G_07028 [Valsa mali var. pyri (nom. inval.)]